ncbi:MAG: ABC transporter ATP-binding protein [Rickettsiales bacterium]|nr:MAG: ABC transporter ATP-binding protein [Rickettsiales bacterium]
MLALKNISKSFPQITAKVLKNINLTIDEGEYCIILGSNGSGKSTLLKIISGEYSADHGQIFLNDIDITKQAISHRAGHISSVAQDITKGVIQDMTLLENMSLSNLRGQDASYKFYKDQSARILESVRALGLGLEKFLHSNMSTLSGGQRQAVATLMAMEPRPSILLLDEHTSALDPVRQGKIMHFTNEYIKQHNITSLMITHNIEDAAKYGNRLIIMHHGEIVFDVKGQEKQALSSGELLDILYKMGGSL